MRNLKHKLYILIFAALLACAALYVPAAAAAEVGNTVYLGGMPAGFTLGIGGAQVVGICEVLSENGVQNPAKAAQLGVGDVIVNFEGVKIEDASDIDAVLSSFRGGEAEITIERGAEKRKLTICPVKDMASGKYKLGVLIRDSISGIGTVTFVRKDGRFASLGHAVAGADGELLPVHGGSIYNCTIVNVVRGERGRAGELKGLFINDKKIATADKNCPTGIFGNMESGFDPSALQEICVSTEAEAGKASIFSTVDGTAPREYSVSIVKVDKNNRQHKNFVIKITDKALIGATGGIVQGMSGSPIVQGGKLIGAVTHVFVNDPTRGYGTSVANMIDE